MRYFIKLSYDGAEFFGWQFQPNAVTVQECLERTLSTLLRERVQVVGAGRTDSKVNAIGYVAHFDYDKVIDTTAIGYKLNAILPRGIVIHSVWQEAPDMHARFSATRREYTYFLHRTKDPFIENHSYFCPWALDVETMNEAARLLLGTHDFRCFEKTGSDNRTSVCTVTEAFWAPYTPSHVALMGFPCPAPAQQPAKPLESNSLQSCSTLPEEISLNCSPSSGSPSSFGVIPTSLPQSGDSLLTEDSATGDSLLAEDSAAGNQLKSSNLQSGSPLSGGPSDADPSIVLSGTEPSPRYLYFRIAADRFLRNMVRAIVGSLLEVGRGRRSVADFAALILPACPPTPADRTAPPVDSPVSASTAASPVSLPYMAADSPIYASTAANLGNLAPKAAGPAENCAVSRKTADGTPFRSLAGESVPGHALFLSRVDY